MSTASATPRTALAPHVAADGNRSLAVTFEQMERMAATMAKSGLFGVKTADQALALMIISQAEGRHPAFAAQEYHIIQGRPSLKADTILARFQQSGGSVEWHVYTDEKVEATFSHPASPKPVKLDWTIGRAKKVVNWNDKKNKMEALTEKLNWQNYPRAMLRSRVISEGVRTCYPGVIVGIYTPEEIEDGIAELDITPTVATAAAQVAESAKNAATALTAEEREEHLKAIREAGNQELLAHAFGAGWTHAGEAKDKTAQTEFKGAYDEKKADLSRLAGLVK